jgi:putative beta-lysine N-acetyltransferase
MEELQHLHAFPTGTLDLDYLRALEQSGHLIIDTFNSRVKVMTPELSAEAALLLSDFVFESLLQLDSSKLLLYLTDEQATAAFLTTPDQLHQKPQNYRCESIIWGFYPHQRDAVIYTRYLADRQNQNHIEQGVRMREAVVLTRAVKQVLSIVEGCSSAERKLPNNYHIRLADADTDSERVCEIMKTILPVYPDPEVHEIDSLRQHMRSSVFAVIEALPQSDGEAREIVAISAAEKVGEAFEIGDCAVIESHRGQHLGNHLFTFIEGELRRRSIGFSFTMARAVSVGMNKIAKESGYTFTGSMPNNCRIGEIDRFETINMWVKRL